MKSKLFLFLTSLFLTLSIHAAPPIISYSGQVTVDGQPYTGTGLFKFAFVDTNGQFSYWSHDGTSTAGSEPTGQLSVPVNAGLYSVMLGDTTLTGMSAIAESIFANHNDVHLRIWFSDGQGFEQLTPDRRFASVPYSLGANGTSTANLVSTGSGSGTGDNNSSTTNIHNYNFGGPLGMGHARLVADGPDNPSTTLVLLSGDSAEIASYVADKPGRLEYAFDAYTISLPRGEDSLLSEQSTLIGPGSVRLTAPTGVVNVAILKVNRASGRDPNKVQGSPAPGSTAPAPAPAIVSVPQTRSVARGGTTTLFVSASGDNLSYQWKKNGSSIAGATSAGLPLQNATGADEGNYTVVISNSEGNVTSAPIVVAVKMPAIPSGVYRINNSNGATGHEVALTGFSIDQHEVTKAFWDEVYAWAVANGYTFTNDGIAEGPEHPVHSINWYDCVKWANALSERDGHTPCYYTDNNCTQVYRTGEVDLTNYNVRWNVDGYRLPTESEWEVAARGGLEGSKYAWGEIASASRSNYDSSLHGKTMIVGSYPSNGYGLFEIGGNLREWVWDTNFSDEIKFDFVENFSEENGTMGYVNANSSTEYLNGKGYFSNDFSQVESEKLLLNLNSLNTQSTSTMVVAEEITFDAPCRITKITFDSKRTSSNAYAIANAKFYYFDNSTALSSQSSHLDSAYRTNNYLNPQVDKLVLKIEILHKYSTVTNFNVFHTKSSKTESLIITLPNATKDSVSHIYIESETSPNIQLSGSLVSSTNQIFYTGYLTNQLIALNSNPHQIIFNLPSGTLMKKIKWSFNDPKGFILVEKRTTKDNHYGENLGLINKRNFSSPANRFSTVGFRLVQRP